MRALTALLNRLASGARAILSKSRVERELDAELQEYLNTAVEHKMASGMSRADATRAARAEMGSVAAVKDHVRDAGWESTVESVWRDARYGLRLLLRSPGFTAVTVITLALGIGANTAVFSVAHAVLLRSLPYPEPQRLVALVPAQKSQPSTADPISYPTFLDWHEQSRSIESMAAYVVAQSALTGLGDADAPITVAVTPNVFSLLGATPLAGRTLLPADGDARAARAVVLSEPFWRDPISWGGSSRSTVRLIRSSASCRRASGSPTRARRHNCGCRSSNSARSSRFSPHAPLRSCPWSGGSSVGSACPRRLPRCRR
jgi:hypothetical protein